MKFNLPTKLRFAIYITTGIGSLFSVYLSSKGFIGVAELELWAGLSAFTNGLAALNTN